MSLAGSSARAAGTLVTTDSGTVGGFEMTNTGISGGIATIMITGVPNTSSALNNVNGASITPEPVTFNGPITLLVHQTGPNAYSLSLSPPTYTKTIGATTGSQAILDYNVSLGATSAALPAFFNASGLVTAVAANANPKYDFSNFSNGKGDFNVTFTATSFGGGATNFDTVFSTVGGTATGSASFSQIAFIPEPTGLALLGIGMTGFLAFRRFLKRDPAA
jgi:hypothetical protein